ncbi:MAG: tRNA (adenosine(37)-N6)-threonylcarbamoyltransferase complex ATPase subunit type 1 TsaE [Lachnospiraceae bacterium]|jgi:tRNA threonylcarbamoyladenosine biosynthesis protein TsaE|nr:tRNA (adenosine(37)-N6)-threonylcarbamoyltransferase complex ATPase subunit type 1 TsaE [Lachnospiraceae bacterium]
MIIETNNPEETYAYAKQLSEGAKPGQVFTLTGDLGVGKTVFTKGFAAGLAVEEDVNSPTFTIVQEYTSGRIPFYHFDVYRIGDIEELDEIGFDDYLYGDGVCMIEWANLIEDALPDKRTDIVIEKDLERGFDYRRITVEEHN